MSWTGPKKAPRMKSEFQLQQNPKHTWEVVQKFGTEGGGMNAGIFKVKLVGDPLDRRFIEKRFDVETILTGWAEKEVVIMNQVKDHEGAVKIYDHFVDMKARKASIFMEFCDMGDLEGVIRGVMQFGPINEHKIWNWFIGLMETLVYLHRGPTPEDDRAVLLYWNHIYHRDIKPANLFLKSDPEKRMIIAKLADFGGADSAHYTFQNKTRATARRNEIYTGGFDAPEYPIYTGATDVWQMALSIACVCVPNVAPQSKQHPTGRAWDQKQPAGRHYSRELNSILSWCLDSDAIRRPRPLDIVKRSKETYSRIKNHLPPDKNPMDVPRQAKASAQAPQPDSSPGPRAATGQRPQIPPHAFSDPEVDRAGRRNNQYGAFVQNQRMPMSPRAVDEVIRNGGGTPHLGLPGGFVPSQGPPWSGSEYFPQSSSGQGGYRRS
ncbi:kinase-like domain-containing protein [Paraphoma chrysanthemicola]|uniref:non-specific serine/threonine protein kinase n=1 Tax=Paraphoma chrysanthemicola TaxID=798071 RepID=A0A8K0R7L2_9PLEO|nr:kinase-like domain-containing protein [Paraphoma chrysanthemicola]